MERTLDIPYRNGISDKCKMDVFLPDSPNGAAIFFVHGGGWEGGSRQQWHAVMEHFCAQGYVCATAGYRLIDDTVFPHTFEDIRTAYAVFKTQADTYGFSPERIASFGSSAGGHLASLLATVAPEDDLGLTDEMPLRDTRPAATVALCTVFSCHKVGGFYKPTFFGMEEDEAPQLYADASPLDRVNGQEGPFLIVVGDADTTTPVFAQEAMRNQLAQRGVRCDLQILPEVGHGYGYGVESDAQKQMLAYADAFLADVLQGS